MKLDRLSPEVVKDLIPLINSLGGLPKTSEVKYGGTKFRYVPLDDMLAAVKKDKNFAFMQPLGMTENGEPYIQCVLIHSSGEVIASDPYRLVVKQGGKKQDEGAEITYSRRYSMASFFGIASDDDTDAQSMEEYGGGSGSQSQPVQYPNSRGKQNGAHKGTQGGNQPKKQNAKLPEDISDQLNTAIKAVKYATGKSVAEVVAELELQTGIKMQDVTVETAQTLLAVLDEMAGAELPF